MASCWRRRPSQISAFRRELERPTRAPMGDQITAINVTPKPPPCTSSPDYDPISANELVRLSGAAVFRVLFVGDWCAANPGDPGVPANRDNKFGSVAEPASRAPRE